ncbi:MAG: alcohol dehydrogenase catalytic domain-containing protein [Lachnospiraceae bacterium]|nr:alcohol dehydrogenase catalytic domain-containing protein [Lachnospiraceae bacterium]
MKALVWENGERISLTERPYPVMQTQSDVVIKIRYSGICGTDLQVVKGNETITPDIIMGHEAVGEIVEKGKHVTEYELGDLVIIDPNQYCCDCENCKKGRTNFCTGWNGGLKIAGINVDGTFAEYFCCHKRYVYKVPDGMRMEAAVLIEPMACVLNNLRAADIKEHESVLVMGSGPMGALCQMIAKNNAGLVVATENSDYRIGECSKFSDYIYKSDALTTEKIREINQGHLFDVIIDTVGNQLEHALTLCEKGGRVIPMGMNKVYSCGIKPYQFISGGIRLIGASEYNQLFCDTIQAARRFPLLESIVTKKYPVTEYRSALREVLGYDPETGKREEITQMKVVLEFQ